MEEKEVIKKLKEHILHCIADHGRLTEYDKGYCIRYIMDFVFFDSADSEKVMKKKAEAFLKEKVLKYFEIPSEKFDNTTYLIIDDCVVIKTKNDGMLCIAKNNIGNFIKELKGIGDAL